MKTAAMLAAAAMTLPVMGSTSLDSDPPPAQIVLPVEDGLTVGELLDVAQGALQVDYFLGADEEVRMREVPVHGSPAIRANQFLAFFEKALLSTDVLYFEIGEDDAVIHQIAAVRQGGRASVNLKSMARVVSPDELPTLADRTTLVTTAYTTVHIPPRDAVNTLQPYFADNFTQNIRHIDGTDVIVMTGHADALNGLVDLLAEIDVPPESIPHDRNFEAFLQRVATLEAQVQQLQAQLARRR